MFGPVKAKREAKFIESSIRFQSQFQKLSHLHTTSSMLSPLRIIVHEECTKNADYRELKVANFPAS